MLSEICKFVHAEIIFWLYCALLCVYPFAAYVPAQCVITIKLNRTELKSAHDLDQALPHLRPVNTLALFIQFIGCVILNCTHWSFNLSSDLCNVSGWTPHYGWHLRKDKGPQHQRLKKTFSNTPLCTASLLSWFVFIFISFSFFLSGGLASLDFISNSLFILQKQWHTFSSGPLVKPTSIINCALCLLNISHNGNIRLMLRDWWLSRFKSLNGFIDIKTSGPWLHFALLATFSDLAWISSTNLGYK